MQFRMLAGIAGGCVGDGLLGIAFVPAAVFDLVNFWFIVAGGGLAPLMSAS